jgi:hypothetical protein
LFFFFCFFFVFCSSRLASSSIQPAPKYFKRNYCPEMDFLYRVGGHM